MLPSETGKKYKEEQNFAFSDSRFLSKPNYKFLFKKKNDTGSFRSTEKKRKRLFFENTSPTKYF